MLGNLAETMKSIVADKKFLIIIVVCSIFIGLAIYVYSYYVAPKLDPDFVPNREFVPEKEQIKQATIYLFYTNWCPHSKKALPIFNSLKEKLEGKPINDVIIHFVAVNGEKEEGDMTSFEKEHKVKVDGYPTIFLVKGDQVVEYDAITTEETLSEFLHTTL